MSDASTTEQDDAVQAPVPLTEPAGGVPPVIDTPEALAEAIDAFAAGTGPVAADAERASGFRYGQATYLAQFKREGAGIALVDTAALPDLSALQEAVGDAEFVFHAASQDLPGMRELGLLPAKVFDTELAARLLGWPKVGLAAVVERVLGLALAKEHSSQDWSTRPLPHDWLVYAALDVEVLVEVRDHLWAELESAGKLEWALEEFEAVRLAGPPEPRVDPWRRTSGTHQIRDPRGLAIVRELWLSRDREAQRRDMSPGRVLRDAAIVAAAQARPSTYDELVAIPEWRSRGTKRAAARWWPTIEKALALPDKELPNRRGPKGDGPPPPRAWKDKRPEAAARLAASKEAIQGLVEDHGMPAENLMQPDAVRRACWEHQGGGEPEIRELLASRGARRWQMDLVAPVLAKAFVEAAEAPPADAATAS
ncbi:HRDC domain-containing protein [Demequina zhanjiangensis]|uniref:HRDC domain-containing protein n=1 Tax=Demequina zhanjiangensis TaxID=3051659 RepID=A0ABT8G1Z9_9MICO|nr:HRDC domain-containing protein [Demequina sp. SYSU T00b26]MDN4472729.1 HRDC domain-containing protein [Demequina sp. SYSU T00b26]